MAQKRTVAPDTPITSYPTPKLADIVITVDVDSRLPGYKALEYGTLYPDQTRYPGAKLVSQAPLDDDRFVRRIYATDRVEQEAYNYAIKYSAGSPDHPIYIRTTIEPRDSYTALADNSPDPVIAGAYLVDEEANPAEGELNSLYLKVTRIYETLPGPWVPFSRYDDDLGLITGRRRSVVNQGQTATLTANTKTSYEARDGSTGVYIELEESWSTTNAEGGSPFPVRNRELYDASRGPVQETRQLVLTTGNEQASLVNDNGVITQTSYEAYNEYLSFRIIQTYSVDGPQLVGNATDNDGQLLTITTQRKASDNYVPPQPTATKTIEVTREDAESLVERVIETPEVFAAPSFSTEKPDPIPEKFRVAIPAKTSQETVEGQAEEPVLGEGELARAEEQRNKFTKRVVVTSRDQTELPVSLEQKATDNDRQLVKVTETLQSGDTEETPSATTTIESQALGDGNYVVTKTEVDEVFKARTLRKTKEDLTPPKFKASQVDTVDEENVAGEIDENITLAQNEFSKTEQQVNKFVKRVSTTSRDTGTATNLTEYVLTNEGQLGQRVLTLSPGLQTITPSATTVDASVEALGDGRTIRTVVTVPNVFSNKTIVVTKPDLTPDKFKASQADTVVEESVAGQINPTVSLLPNQFRKSEQQVTEFVKRVSTTSRNTATTTDLIEYVVTPQGQLATRTLRLSSGGQTIQPDARLVDGSIEALGDGRTVKTEVRVSNVFDSKTISLQKPDTIPEKFRSRAPIIKTEEIVPQTNTTIASLGSAEYSKTEQRLTEFTVQRTAVVRPDFFNTVRSQRLEENWGVAIPYTEYVSTSIPQGKNYEGEGLDHANSVVRQYDLAALDSELGSFSVSIPTSVDLDLPRVLKSINVSWQKEQTSSSSESDTTGIQGEFTSLTQDDAGSVSSTLLLVPTVDVEFNDVWGKNIPGTIHLFFLKKSEISTNRIRSKCGAQSSWPVFSPKSFSTTIFGKSETKTIESRISRAMQVNDTDSGYGYQPSKTSVEYSRIALNPISINIPPCLCAGIQINSSDNVTADSEDINLDYDEVTATKEDGTVVTFPAVSIKKTLNHSLQATVSFNVPSTSPSEIPSSGVYLLSSSAEPYKFGWFLVRAVTFDASNIK